MLVRMIEEQEPFEKGKLVEIICQGVFHTQKLYLAKKHIMDDFHGGASAEILRESIKKGIVTSPAAIQLAKDYPDSNILHGYWWIAEGEFEVEEGATNEDYLGFLKSF